MKTLLTRVFAKLKNCSILAADELLRAQIKTKCCEFVEVEELKSLTAVFIVAVERADKLQMKAFCVDEVTGSLR